MNRARQTHQHSHVECHDSRLLRSRSLLRSVCWTQPVAHSSQHRLRQYSANLQEACKPGPQAAAGHVLDTVGAIAVLMANPGRGSGFLQNLKGKITQTFQELKQDLSAPSDPYENRIADHVQRATSELLTGPDWGLNCELIDTINNDSTYVARESTETGYDACLSVTEDDNFCRMQWNRRQGVQGYQKGTVQAQRPFAASSTHGAHYI